MMIPSCQKMKNLTFCPCSSLQEFTLLPDFSMAFHYLFSFMNKVPWLQEPREDTILTSLTEKVKGKESQ